jgi:hypothetical protein
MPKTSVLQPPAKRTLLAIRVNFELNTPDGLRRVVFGLEKDAPDDHVVWKIAFQLFERDTKTEPYGDALVNLRVEVNSALNDAAEDAAHGLTSEQTAHVLGPAADDVKAAQSGEIDMEDAQQTVQDTLTAGVPKL